MNHVICCLPDQKLLEEQVSDPIDRWGWELVFERLRKLTWTTGIWHVPFWGRNGEQPNYYHYELEWVVNSSWPYIPYRPDIYHGCYSYFRIKGNPVLPCEVTKLLTWQKVWMMLP